MGNINKKSILLLCILFFAFGCNKLKNKIYSGESEKISSSYKYKDIYFYTLKFISDEDCMLTIQTISYKNGKEYNDEIKTHYYTYKYKKTVVSIYKEVKGKKGIYYKGTVDDNTINLSDYNGKPLPKLKENLPKNHLKQYE